MELKDQIMALIEERVDSADVQGTIEGLAESILELFPKPTMIPSSHVTTVTVIDPDSEGEVDVEIRKLATGAMIGFDGSFLEQLADDENPNSPYDDNAKILVPSNEAGYCFVTSDGFTLCRVNREDGSAYFTDGDHTFEINEEGHPITAEGEALEGSWDDEPATCTLTQQQMHGIKTILELPPDTWSQEDVEELAAEHNVPEYVLIKLGIGTEYEDADDHIVDEGGEG